MSQKTKFNHIAVQCKNRKNAKIFYSDILGLPLEKTFSLDEDLSREIFGINKKVDVDVYSNGQLKFEIFIVQDVEKQGYCHSCIEVNSKDEFLSNCKKYNIQTILVDKNGKKLLFAKDSSDNLFEIKEIENK